MRGAVRTVGLLPDRSGGADPFCGLAASFYSLGTKKTPMGRRGVKSWLGGLLVPTWPKVKTGAGWLGTGWLVTMVAMVLG